MQHRYHHSTMISSTNTNRIHILVLGLGELGTAIVEAFLANDSYNSDAIQLSVLVRPSTSEATKSIKDKQAEEWAKRNVKTVYGDLENSTQAELTKLFHPATTVVHAGGMTLAPGIQLKVSQAVLATESVQMYIPWQFGVDYDQIGYEGGQGMFTEQLKVRELLRSQNEVDWLVIGCGVFMSFLFEPFWGVIERDSHNKISKVRALGSWENLLTATTAKDIGRCTAQVLLDDTHLRNQTVYIAGDSLTYKEFADLIEKVNGQSVERELWTTEHLRQDSQADPDDKLKKYRVVFSEGKGLAWPMEQTWNYEKPGNFNMTGFEQYISESKI